MTGSVSTPKDNFRGYFNMQSITVVDNLTIPKNDHFYNQYAFTAPKIEGYTPVGIMDWHINNATNSGTGLTWCFIYRCWIDNSNGKISLGIRNTNPTGAAKVKVDCKVMYVKEN